MHGFQDAFLRLKPVQALIAARAKLQIVPRGAGMTKSTLGLQVLDMSWQ